jgi:NAD(P)-dependent dehydrogenase (short-subunit alcohol dehydrogenase family)
VSHSSQVLLPVKNFLNHLRHIAPADSEQGISQATAVSFAREGCTKIVLADRDEKGLEKTQQLIADAVGESKVQVLAVKTDVTSVEQIDHLVQSAVKSFGRIDYAINGAGEHWSLWALLRDSEADSE